MDQSFNDSLPILQHQLGSPTDYGIISTDDRKVLESDDSSIETEAQETHQCHCKCTCASLKCSYRRLMVVFTICLGMVVMNAMRISISLTAVMIVDNGENNPVNLAEMNLGLIGSSENISQILHFHGPNVKWNPMLLGILHASFFIGFLITQIPAGFLAIYFSATRLFGFAILFSALCNFFIPSAITYGGFTITCILRLIQGLAEGFTKPALYMIVKNWSPVTERSSLAAFCITGQYVGTFLGFTMDGAINYYIGWEKSYYIHSGICLGWFLIWFLFIYELPAQDPWITEDELNELQATASNSKVKKRIPWSSILTSAPVWTLMIAHFSSYWAYYQMVTNQPLYLRSFNFSFLKIGLYSAIPHIIKVMFSYISGCIADSLMINSSMTVTETRKFMTGISYSIFSLTFLILVFINDGTTAVVLLCIGIGLSGLATGGWMVNHLDLAPELSGVLAGLSMTTGTLGAVLSPLITGFITKPQDLYSWQLAFIPTGIILLLCVVIYSIFGSGELQPWAISRESEETIMVDEKSPELKAKVPSSDV